MPQLTPLQFLVVHLLFAGRQSSVELRKAIKDQGVRQGPAAFSRFMWRLAWQGFVERDQRVRPAAGHTVRECSYAVTDYGVMAWNQTRQFYAELAGPGPDLVPIATEEGRLAGLSPKVRKAAIRQELAKEFPLLFRRRRKW